MVKNLPTNLGDMGPIPRSGRFPGEGNGNPLQYSCLENPMDQKPGGLWSMGCKRVGYDLVTKQQHNLHKQKVFGSPTNFRSAK